MFLPRTCRGFHQAYVTLPTPLLLLPRTTYQINYLGTSLVVQWLRICLTMPMQVPGAIVGDPTHDEVMKKIPDRQGRSGYEGPSRLALASTPPCIQPPFLLLFLFALLQILVLPAESSPAPLSLNKDQLKTLINKSPRLWYPMKGPEMKERLQFKPFCWHSGLFDKCVLPLQEISW